LELLKKYYGADTPLAEITSGRISAWKNERLAAICPSTKRPYSAAAVNRPLAALRHLLRLAHDEWELLEAVPRIRLEKEPQGRIRWLEPDEEQRLLDACRGSRTKHLVDFVTVAMESGLRKGELFGLTWDRVDLSRGVLRLEVTKSGKRREVPMRQAVYDILAAIPANDRVGRVWPSGSIRRAFESAVAGAKLDDLHFHDLRHHFASWFVMRGGLIQALKEILGHADLKMTLRYAHLAPEHLRGEIVKTERRSPSIENVNVTITAQESLEEVLELESIAAK
jgi:integrase